MTNFEKPKETGPANPAPTPKKVKYPKPGKEAPKAPGWAGKKTWASKVDGEWLFTELLRRLQLAQAEVLVQLADEIEGPSAGESAQKPRDFRAKIYERMKKDGGHA
jgi:hypothetical protein